LLENGGALLRIEQERPLLTSVMYYAFVVLIALGWRWHSFAYPAYLGYDEAIYQQDAATLGEQGVAGFREVIAQWPTDKNLRVGPPPFRPLWLYSATLGCRILGGYSTHNLVLVSAFFGFATIVVGAMLARRWFGLIEASAISLLLIVSPLADAMSRRGLQDTCFAFVVALCVLLLDRYWRSGKAVDLTAFGCALLAAFLTKESTLFLYPAFGAALFFHAREVPWHERRAVLAAFAIGPVLALLVLLWFAGGWDPLANAYAAYADIPRNDYAARFQQGPWFRYLVDLLLLSPLTLLLALIGATTLHRASPIGAKLACAYLVAGLATLSMMPTLNARFVLGLDVFLRMAAVVGIVELCRRLGTGVRARSAAIALVLLVAVSDVVQFNRIFANGGVYDPVTAELVKANRLAPR